MTDAGKVVLLMRLLGWGAIVALAFVVLNQRADRVEAENGIVQMSGKTDQGMPIVGGADWGEIQAIQMNLRFECNRPTAKHPPWSWNLETTEDRFLRDGRRFSVRRERELPNGGDWTYYSVVTVDGELAADGETAHGRAEARVTWTRAGKPTGDECHAATGWTLRRSS